MSYEIRPTTMFRRGYKLAKKRGWNLAELALVINYLRDGVPLEPKYHDHALTGNWQGHRECHIAPDWLLIYRVYEDVLVLELTRTGTHADLFD